MTNKDENKLRILIIASRFFMGGFSRSLINFLLCANEYEELDITVLTFEKNETDEYKDIPQRFHYIDLGQLEFAPPIHRGVNRGYLFNIHRLRNLEYIFVQIFSKLQRKDFPHKTAMKFMSFSEIDRAKRVITDFSFCQEYDVAISWEEVFCNYLLVEKIPTKYKIGYIHPNYKEALFCKQADKPYLEKLDGIVAISKYCKDTLCEVFPEYRNKIVYLPNRLFLNRLFTRANQYEAPIKETGINLLTVCRIVDNHKAVYRIVDLSERLKNEGFCFTWYIIGKGPDMEELQKRIAENHLDDTVVCLGEMDNPCPYMKAVDLYVMQSHYEGRPVAVDEAMALGTPALVTSYSSASEQVADNQTGWIVPDDEDAIYAQLRYLITNQNAIKKAKENLTNASLKDYEECDSMINYLKGIMER